MLTILAWAVFLPALFYNLVLWHIIMTSVATNEWKDFVRIDNLITLVFSTAFLFIPGVYLFGWM